MQQEYNALEVVIHNVPCNAKPTHQHATAMLCVVTNSLLAAAACYSAGSALSGTHCTGCGPQNMVLDGQSPLYRELSSVNELMDEQMNESVRNERFPPKIIFLTFYAVILYTCAVLLLKINTSRIALLMLKDS